MWVLRLVPLLALAVGCGSSPTTCTTGCDDYATFQACYDDHHGAQAFTPVRAIEICCISHGIGEAMPNVVCGDTAESCTVYVTAHVMDSADPTLTGDIATACAGYVNDRR